MKLNKRKLINISLGLMAAGAVLTAIGFAAGGRPGVVLSNKGFVSTSEYSKPIVFEKKEIGSFKNVNLHLGSYADVKVLPSKDDKFYLEYQLDGSFSKPTHSISGDTFTFTQKNGIGPFVAFHFESISSDEAYVNLYVPENTTLNSFTLYNDSGDVSLKGLKSEDTEITIEYGEADIKDCTFDSLSLTVDSGDTKLHNIAAGSLIFSSEYGSADISNYNGKTAVITMDSGDVNMELSAMERLECNSEYGDIDVTLPEELTVYSFDLITEYGEIRLPDDAPHGFYNRKDISESEYRTDGTGNKTIKMYTDSGDVTVRSMK